MSEKSVKGTPLWVAGDLNGFFGLFSNSLTNFLTAVGLLAGAILMPGDIVFGKIVPAAALTIALGNFVLGYFAKKLSIKQNSANVTAMPYGLSVPHYFVVSLGVMLPVYLATNDWYTAWGTGMAWSMIQGIIMLAGAFLGPFLKKHVPSSAMLGALAGFALTFIAGNPIGEVYTVPYIGLICFIILMVGWLSHKRLPFGIPAGAFAIIIGTVIAWLTGFMDASNLSSAVSGFGFSTPIFTLDMLLKGFQYVAPFLPAAIPLGIYDFLESLDNLESAHAEGEHYPIAMCMSVPALLTIVSAFFGNVFPTIIYIGHPGWKAAGARIGYSFATGAGILLLSFTGLLKLVSAVIPLAALLPILVYIGMVIGTQAFATAKRRHMPAIILAFIPFVGSFLSSKINSVITAVNGALAAAGTDLSVVLSDNASEGSISITNALLSSNGVPFKGWAMLGQGDIIIAMLLSTIVIFTIDKLYIKAAVYCIISAALSFFGIIHASSFGINASPYAALGYVGMAVILFLMTVYRKQDNVPDPEVLAEQQSSD